MQYNIIPFYNSKVEIEASTLIIIPLTISNLKLTYHVKSF